MNDAQRAELYGRLRELIASHVTFLADKPEENPDSSLRALWFTAAGSPRSARAAADDRELPALDAAAQERLESFVSRRLAGVPLSHLTMRQSFLGLEMLAGPEALIPRKETELLARTALEKLTELAASRKPLRVIDVCTGSGNIALVLAHRDPSAEVFAADLSEDAVRLARANAAHLGLDRKVEFRAGDLLAPFDEPAHLGQVDLLTCNPPYIGSAKVGAMPAEISGHEPRLAFDGGALGISILMRLSQEAPRFLRPGGWLVFEIGLGQGPALVKRLKASPAFKEVAGVMDSEGAIRVVAARC